MENIPTVVDSMIDVTIETESETVGNSTVDVTIETESETVGNSHTIVESVENTATVLDIVGATLLGTESVGNKPGQVYIYDPYGPAKVIPTAKYQQILESSPFAAAANAKPRSAARPYQCAQCGSSFKLKHNLKTHFRIHTGEKKFKCGQCNKYFLERCDLRKHQKIHSGEKTHVCEYCNRAFLLNHQLTRHRKTHTGDKKQFKCPACDKTFLLLDYLNTHFKIVHMKVKQHTCELCEKEFFKKSALDQHVMRTHDASLKPFPCEGCDRTFCTSNDLKKHKEVQYDRCNECNVSFYCVSAMRDHMVIHPLGFEKTFVCKTCKKAFGRKADYRAHLRQMHSDDNVLVKITETGSTDENTQVAEEEFQLKGNPEPDSDVSNDMENLENLASQGNVLHVVVDVKREQTHNKQQHTHDEKCVALPAEHLCEECGMCFHRKADLEGHVRTHRGVCPFKCDVCGRGFSQKKHLSIHRRYGHVQINPHIQQTRQQLAEQQRVQIQQKEEELIAGIQGSNPAEVVAEDVYTEHSYSDGSYIQASEHTHNQSEVVAVSFVQEDPESVYYAESGDNDADDIDDNETNEVIYEASNDNSQLVYDTSAVEAQNLQNAYYILDTGDGRNYVIDPAQFNAIDGSLNVKVEVVPNCEEEGDQDSEVTEEIDGQTVTYITQQVEVKEEGDRSSEMTAVIDHETVTYITEKGAVISEVDMESEAIPAESVVVQEQCEGVTGNQCEGEAGNQCEGEAGNQQTQQREAVTGNQCEGEAVTGNQCEGEAVTGNQCEGEAVTGNQCEGEAVTGNQCEGEAVTGNQCEGEAVTGNQCEGEAVTGNQCEGEAVTGNQQEQQYGSVDECKGEEEQVYEVVTDDLNSEEITSTQDSHHLDNQEEANTIAMEIDVNNTVTLETGECVEEVLVEEYVSQLQHHTAQHGQISREEIIETNEVVLESEGKQNLVVVQFSAQDSVPGEKEVVVVARQLLSCEECELQFIHRRQLQEHNIQVHIGVSELETSLVIDSEGKTGSGDGSSNYQADEDNVSYEWIDGTEDRPFRCPKCLKCYSLKQHFKAHCETHSTVKPWQCRDCGKRFKQKCDYNKHCKIHIDYRPYKCNQCNLRFREVNKVKRHLKTHANDKNYKCLECDKQFKCEEYLNQHMKRHLKVKPFQCSVCARSFLRRVKYEEHLQTGGCGGKHLPPHVCDECGTECRTHTEFSNHVKERLCRKCNIHFNCLASYQEHRQKNHNVTTTERVTTSKCVTTTERVTTIERVTRNSSQESGDDKQSETKDKKPGLCDECGACFATPSYLKTHKALKHSHSKQKT